ncbi:MAG: Gfo/Idh/MocA family oxidoreductase [Desulfatiglandales bacterium]
MNSKQEKLRVGVVGVGHLGQYHVQKYAALHEAELVGVLDVDRAKADDVAQRCGTRAFQDLDSLLGEVDAVSLAVPTENHFEEALKILDRDVHLLVEKPITYRVDHAATLVESARRKSLILQVGHVERFSPPVIKMTSLLKAPLFIECHRMNVFTVRGTDVDVVLDLMIHDLDIVLNAVHSPVLELHAVGMKVLTGTTDIANARLIFGNGTAANLTASRVSNKTLRKIRVFQPDAYISVNCARRDISITRMNGSLDIANRNPEVVTSKLTYPESDPLADQISSFVRAVLTGSDPVVSGEDGRLALEVALQIMDQIEQGCKHFKYV